MSIRYSITEARSNLPKLVREAVEGKTVELTRHGETIAVVLGLKQYQRFVVRRKHFSSAWDHFTRAIDLADLDIDPDQVFADVRDSCYGRNHRRD